MKLQKYFHYICYMYNIGELYMGIRIFYVPQLLGIFLACHSIISFTYIHFFAQFSYIVSEISTTYLTTKLHVRPTTYPHIIFPCSISIISRLQSICTKGQLISKCLFGVIVWTKKPTKFFPGFLPQPLKRGQIKKIKALYYTNQGLFNIIGIIKFLIQPLF